MAEDERILIFTMRVADSKLMVDGSVQAKCDDCEQPVLVSPTTLPVMQKNPQHRLICNQCCFPYLSKIPPDELEIETADPELTNLVKGKEREIVESMLKRSLGR